MAWACGLQEFPDSENQTEIWISKTKANRNRDDRAMTVIHDAGWRSLVVWECATRSICVDDLVRIIAAWLQGAETSAELKMNGVACSGEFKPRIVGKQEE